MVSIVVGAFVGAEVSITIGALVVGLPVVIMGVFVGVSVGGGGTGNCCGDCVVRIGFREGIRMGATTGAGVTLISGSSITNNAGMTIPPLYSIGTTRNCGIVSCDDVPSSPVVGTGNNILIQQSKINRKEECRMQELFTDSILCILFLLIILKLYR